MTMEIKRVPISEVEVWDKNPRNIKTKDFERLKRQIQELGVYKPLICFRENGKYTTLGGNMRLRALKDLSMKEIDISIVEAKDEATKIKYALSDNDRVGQYDEQALAELTYPHIEEINLEDYKLDIGEPISLKDVIEDYGPDIDGEDEVPEIDDSPAITKIGDLFTLSKHRLLCGDATKEEDVKRLMGDKLIDLEITSPPYWNMRGYSEWEKYEDYLKDMKLIMKNVFNYSNSISACLWNIGTDVSNEKDMPADHSKLLREIGFKFKGSIAWIKSGTSSSSMRSCHIILNYHYYPLFKWEPLMIFIKNKYPKFERKDVDYVNSIIGDVWEICQVLGSEQKSLGHFAPFPLELAKRAIKSFSKEGSIISDVFLGSGTTLIASEGANRICYGMEIEPKYCDVIITRYANFTDTPEEEIRVTKENG